MQLQGTRGIDGPHGRSGTVQDAEERVVVLLADRVELVVVAASAGNGEPKEGLGEHVDLVVRPLHAFFPRVNGLVAEFDQAQVGRAENRLVDAAAHSDPRFIDKVACKVLADELIVRNVRVQGANEVIAVVPRVRYGRIAFAAVRVGVAH